MSERFSEDSYEVFVRANEKRLRQALCATLGTDVGRDAAADALAYGWEHWDRIGSMRNPAGYLYVVGRDKGRKALQRRKHVSLMPVNAERSPWIEPGLPRALVDLSDKQRLIVMLLHSFQWTLGEVADLLDISKSTAQSHAERGMTKLRSHLGVTP